MGTDIHFTFQRFNSQHSPPRWEDVDSLYQRDRHYLLFAALADVRNGYGFAGVPIFEPIEPISKPRGLPDDLLRTLPGPVQIVDENDEEEWERTHQGYRRGDHSFSWLTADEMLAWYDQYKDKDYVQFGVISRQDHEKLKFGEQPTKGYCGWISGRNILVLPDYAVRAAKEIAARHPKESESQALGLLSYEETLNQVLQVTDFMLYTQDFRLIQGRDWSPVRKYLDPHRSVWRNLRINEFYDRVEVRDMIGSQNRIALKDYTHVRVLWSIKLIQELKYFFDEVQRLRDLHGDVRMVFSFDS